MVALVGIGHSHLHCVSAAYKERAAQLPGLRYVPMCLLDPPYSQQPPPGDPTPVFARALAEVMRNERQVAVFLFCGGSEHVRFGLANQPRPFDFVEPDRPEAPLVADEVVPYGMMRGLAAVNWVGQIIEAVRQVAPLPLVHLCPPPPVRDADFILRKVGGQLAQDLARYGVAPSEFRARVWRVCVTMMRELCEANDVTFLPVPSEAVEPDDCLGEHFAWDFVHASTSYGDLLLDSLLARIATAFPHARLADPLA
jgi:hypothetical protein